MLTVKLDWDAMVFRVKLNGQGPNGEPLFKAVSKMGRASRPRSLDRHSAGRSR